MQVVKIQLSLILAFLFFLAGKSVAQQLLASMPEPVSNNAVVGYSTDALEQFVYSFAGIGAGLTHNDVHQKCWKYDLFTDQWTALPDLPSGPSRVAAGASVVKDKIYIMGGYHIFQNGNELSLSEVHILDTRSDSFLANGKRIPIPTDDHVQVVWRDSLIYLVTGWSQTTNISQVQVYDPAHDSWAQATPVPSAGAYKVFGGSGCIIGDTIYYAGGARIGTNFPPTNYLRKGVINPDNPLEIEWTIQETDDAVGYRMASDVAFGKPIWLGGSSVTYNYDGVAYNGSGVVSPTGQVKVYDTSADRWIYHNSIMRPTMDFRGTAAVTTNSWILAGGMKEDQQVTDEVQLIILPPLGNDVVAKNALTVRPNPAAAEVILEVDGSASYSIRNVDGRVVLQGTLTDQEYIDLRSWPNGTYYVLVRKNRQTLVEKFLKQ